MKNCEHIQGELSAYLDHELSPDERAVVATHLKNCADCQALLTELTEVQSALGDLPKQAAPATLPQRISTEIHQRASASGRETSIFSKDQVWMRLAAMVLLGVLVFLVLSSSNLGNNAPAPSAVAEKSVASASPVTTKDARRQESAKAVPADSANQAKPNALVVAKEAEAKTEVEDSMKTLDAPKLREAAADANDSNKAEFLRTESKVAAADEKSKSPSSSAVSAPMTPAAAKPQEPTPVILSLPQTSDGETEFKSVRRIENVIKSANVQETVAQLKILSKKYGAEMALSEEQDRRDRIFDKDSETKMRAKSSATTKQTYSLKIPTAQRDAFLAELRASSVAKNADAALAKSAKAPSAPAALAGELATEKPMKPKKKESAPLEKTSSDASKSTEFSEVLIVIEAESASSE